MWSIRRRRRAPAPPRFLISPLVDPLTGVGTRQAMKAAIDALTASSRPGGFALLEVDGFEALALRRGDEHANRVQRRLSRRLTSIEHAATFRLADGRFALVLAAAGDLHTWAEDLSSELAGACPGITVSIGTARAERDLPPAAVEERASQALRAAKRRGGGSCVDFATQKDPAPDELTPDDAQALYDVLADGYLRVNYQPIIDLHTGRTIAFEALARPQATHGLHGPHEAFQVAARLGLIPELDAVCRASIFGEGPGFDMPAGTNLHINISPLSLGHRSLTTPVLRRQLDAAGLDANRVVLELTEDHPVDTGVTDRELRRLAQAGFTLMLDDVGARSAGLSRLMTGLFDGVKIANDVIAASATSVAAVGVVEAVCAFARRTGSTVIAEGVEDAEMLAFVQSFRPIGDSNWRIPAAQGYALGRPQPAAKVAPAASAPPNEPSATPAAPAPFQR